jgi:phenylpropionate dioxygenase-like ring-hydroxylating dioxygenase large terminal subunit|tara:strand:- start:223 stop:594 length:372 start_codon:yes stop_codon:yes gene_type:complete
VNIKLQLRLQLLKQVINKVSLQIFNNNTHQAEEVNQDQWLDILRQQVNSQDLLILTKNQRLLHRHLFHQGHTQTSTEISRTWQQVTLKIYMDLEHPLWHLESKDFKDAEQVHKTRQEVNSLDS